MKGLIKLTFLILLSNVIALKMFKSNSNDNGEEIISGLHYKSKVDDIRLVLSNSLTICIRFNIKRYGTKMKNTAQILEIENKKFTLLGLRATYPTSTLFWTKSNSKDKILRWLYDPKRRISYPMWKLYIWHHVCYSYSKKNSHISFVRVRKNNVNVNARNLNDNFQFSVIFKRMEK